MRIEGVELPCLPAILGVGRSKRGEWDAKDVLWINGLIN
jgi:hypothetical protein